MFLNKKCNIFPLIHNVSWLYSMFPLFFNYYIYLGLNKISLQNVYVFLWIFFLFTLLIMILYAWTNLNQLLPNWLRTRLVHLIVCCSEGWTLNSFLFLVGWFSESGLTIFNTTLIFIHRFGNLFFICYIIFFSLILMSKLINIINVYVLLYPKNITKIRTLYWCNIFMSFD